ncbi:MAG: hypothetical protein M3R41_11205, partial [Pseudomonadota bacterium]|nr:hypothetical protein [Pseudomonadota bacterium]
MRYTLRHDLDDTMMGVANAPMRNRIAAGAGALAVELGLCLALIAGLALHSAHTASEAVATFELLPSPPPPKPVVVPRRRAALHKAPDARAPPNLRAQATEIVAPSLVLPPPPVG